MNLVDNQFDNDQQQAGASLRLTGQQNPSLFSPNSD
jgi:hypothetical protein